MTQRVHYVAHVTIHKVTVEDGLPPSPATTQTDRRHFTAPTGKPVRNAVELANLTIKNNDLATLRGKISAHVDLVDEADVVADETGVTHR